MTTTDLTLEIYAYQHLVDKGHRTVIFGNFAECDTCGEHVHMSSTEGRVIRHNRDYSDYTELDFSYPPQYDQFSDLYNVARDAVHTDSVPVMETARTQAYTFRLSLTPSNPLFEDASKIIRQLNQRIFRQKKILQKRFEYGKLHFGF